MPKVSRKQLTGTGECPFCGTAIEMAVSVVAVRIFRCKPCGLFGQAMMPPSGFRVTRRELKRKRNRWRVAS